MPDEQSAIAALREAIEECDRAIAGAAYAFDTGHHAIEDHREREAKKERDAALARVEAEMARLREQLQLSVIDAANEMARANDAERERDARPTLEETRTLAGALWKFAPDLIRELVARFERAEANSNAALDDFLLFLRRHDAAKARAAEGESNRNAAATHDGRPEERPSQLIQET